MVVIQSSANRTIILSNEVPVIKVLVDTNVEATEKFDIPVSGSGRDGKLFGNLFN